MILWLAFVWFVSRFSTTLGVVSLASDATIRKRVFDRFSMGESDVEQYAQTIQQLRVAGYTQRLREIAADSNFPFEITQVDRDVLQQVTGTATSVARSVVQTYNDDLRQHIAILQRDNPHISQAQLSSAIRDWQANRAEWKASQITHVEGMVARRAATNDVVKKNGITARARAVPEHAQCDRCKQLVGLGWQTYERAQAALNDATHVNCVHDLEIEETVDIARDIYWLGTTHDLTQIAADDNLVLLYNPHQARDAHGRWASGGSRSRAVSGGHAQERSMLQDLRASGGFTYQATKGVRKSIGSEGFAVSPYQNREHIIEGRQATRADIHSFVAKNRDLLSRPNHYIGGWYDPETKRTYLDVSIVAPNRQIAERLSREHKQEAYFDFSTGESVYTHARQESGIAATESNRYGNRWIFGRIVREDGTIELAWSEHDHPRDSHGRFTSGHGHGGAGGGGNELAIAVNEEQARGNPDVSAESLDKRRQLAALESRYSQQKLDLEAEQFALGQEGSQKAHDAIVAWSALDAFDRSTRGKELRDKYPSITDRLKNDAEYKRVWDARETAQAAVEEIHARQQAVANRQLLLESMRLDAARNIAVYKRTEEEVRSNPALKSVQMQARSPEVATAMRRGQMEFERMLGPKAQEILRSQPTGIGKGLLFRQMPPTDPMYPTGRSYFEHHGPGEGMAKLVVHPTRISPGEIIHEYGHYLEDSSPTLQQARKSWYVFRTQGQPLEPMGRGYSDYEKTRPDRFKERYMGKEYPGGFSSEVISMAMELFYSDPIGLAHDDPNLFDFISNTVA